MCGGIGRRPKRWRGWGGNSAVAVATGLARNTVAAGVHELTQRGDQANVTIDIS